MKNKKILYFEGAGCVPSNDVENCRIRTAFTNKEGKKIYIELFSGYKHTKIEYGKNGRKLKHSKWISEDGYICCDFCHYITDDPEIDDCNESRLSCERNTNIEKVKYTKENILAFVNENCNADFEEVVILNSLAGFKVFTGAHTETSQDYNFGDCFKYDAELTEKRIAKVKEMKKHFAKIFDQKYDNTSYYIEDGQLVARINVTEEKRIAAGYNERKIILEV